VGCRRKGRLRLPTGRLRLRHVDRLVALDVDPSAAQRREVRFIPAELGAELARHVGGLPARTTVAEFIPLLAALAASVEAGGSPGALP